MTESATSLAWLAWTDACARARAEDRPIVLVLETRWARPPEAFQSVLNDEAVLSALSGAAFLAAKADADRRPDLADRYGFGEWPSIACLTPSCALIGGAAATSPELADLLRRVADAWRSRRSDVERAATRAQEPSEPAEPTEPLEPMEPMEPLEPLEPLDRTEPSCPDEIRVLLMENPDAARTALDRIAAAPQATLLASNADILDLFTHAGVLLSEERYLDHAAGIARFVRTALVDPSGGFAAGILADPAGVDATLYVDANARMVSAMVRAGAVLDAPDLTETAIAALERVVLATYRPGNGVGHVCDDPDFRGLLVDHVWLAEALMDAYDATAREPYGMLAAELLHYCVRVLWDANGGGFFDRAEPAQPLKPFALNCRAARTLRRAAEVCGEPMFGERASTTLQALTPAARLHQSDAAALALALLDAEAK